MSPVWDLICALVGLGLKVSKIKGAISTVARTAGTPAKGLLSQHPVGRIMHEEGVYAKLWISEDAMHASGTYPSPYAICLVLTILTPAAMAPHSSGARSQIAVKTLGHSQSWPLRVPCSGIASGASRRLGSLIMCLQCATNPQDSLEGLLYVLLEVYKFTTNFLVMHRL